MKRSDMIEAIASLLILQELAGTTDPVEQANDILELLEIYKMLPPERPVDPKKKLGAAGPLKYYVNEWEDEDACMGK